MKKIITVLILISCFSLIYAQKPTVHQSKTIVITGGTVHMGNGTVMENATIVIESGKIKSISSAAQNIPGAEIIDAKGKHIYPGLISPISKLGLEEVEAVRATLDYREVGLINPDVRSLIAYNTDSKIIPTVRSNGILTTLIVPEGGLIPGTSSVMKMDGWNWEDAVYKTDIAIHLNWPSGVISTAWWAAPAEEQKEAAKANMQEIKKLFDEAKSYNELNPAVKNLRLEAMRGLFDGTKKLLIRVNYAKDIMSAVSFAKMYNITPVVVGGSESYLITDFLKENNIPVILSEVHALPPRDDDDVDLPYRRAKLLKDAGILYCLSIEGSWQQRNLPFMAGTTVAYGVSKEEALMSITSNTAKILGIDQTLGTIETGKDATMIIVSGDVLDMRSSIIEQAFIKGDKIDLDNKQKELYRKYAEKYKLKIEN